MHTVIETGELPTHPDQKADIRTPSEIELHFQAGGALAKTAFYVERPADRELPEALVRGELCYVLTTRQMGKSSLRVRAMRTLQDQRVACASIDLSGIGVDDTVAEDWYYGLAYEIADQLAIELPDAFWDDHRGLTAVHRFSCYLEDHVLQMTAGPVVIFIDEIDATLSLPFSRDDFFAAVRSLYNRRADRPENKRLTFCLLGVAAPGDLIADPTRTPFNIGRAIRLEDFDRKQAAVFERGLAVLGPDAAQRIDEVLAWTHGHPYMTQRVCRDLIDSTGKWSVSDLVKARFLRPGRHEDPTLAYAEREFGSRGATRPGARDGRNLDRRVQHMLHLYRRILIEKALIHPEPGNQAHRNLKLTGMVAERESARRGRVLAIRNRIFRRAFGRDWLRRQESDRVIADHLASWLASQRSDDALPRGAALAEIKDWARSRDDLTDDEHALLYACERVDNARRRRSMRRRGLRILTGVLMLAVIVLLVLLMLLRRQYGIAEYQAGQANAEKQRAIRETKRVIVAEKDAQKEARRALDAESRARDETARARDAETRARDEAKRARDAALRERSARRSARRDAERAREAEKQATEEAARARAAEALAAKQARRAQMVEIQARAEADRAVLAANDSEVRRLAGMAALTSKPRDTVRRQLLALEILRASGRASEFLQTRARQALLDALDHIPENRPLRGHDDAVVAVAYSPDGSRVVTASGDGTARVWPTDGSGAPIVLRGHQGWIHSAAFSPDGARVVTASRDRDARVWRLTGHGVGATITRSVVLRGHAGPVRSAVFSPDGARVVTASEDRTARVWRADGAGKSVILHGHTDWVSSAVFSPDGDLILTTSYDETARIWQPADAKLLATLRTSEGRNGRRTICAAFSPDGRRIAIAARGGAVRVWRATPKRNPLEKRPAPAGQWREAEMDPPVVLGHHEGFVSSVTFSPDGRRIATASDDRTVRLWQPSMTPPLRILRGHGDSVVKVVFSPDSTRLLSASNDGTAWIWQVDDRAAGPSLAPAPPVILRGHEHRVSSAMFSPDGTQVVTGSWDSTARLWRADGQGQPQVLRGHRASVNSAVFSPDGRLVVTASPDGTARVWRSSGGGQFASLRHHRDQIRRALFSPDGQRIATVSRDMTAVVRRLDGTGRPVVLRGHQDWLLNAAFSSDGRRLVTASDDRTARVWPVDGKGEPVVLRGHANWVFDAEFSRDGRQVVTASQDGTARVWRSDGKGAPVILRGHEKAVHTAAFSPDGRYVVTASADGTARVWRASGKGRPVILRGHEGLVHTAAFSPDGRYVVTASQDKTARVWRADGTGQPVILRGHKNRVFSAEFSPDGRTIITASQDRTARLWRPDGRGEPVVLRGHEDSLWHATFSLDGTRVVSASSDGTARVWTLSLVGLGKAACAYAGRNFTPAEWAELFPGAPYRKTCARWPAGHDE